MKSAILTVGLLVLIKSAVPRNIKKQPTKFNYESQSVVDPNYRTRCPEDPENRPSNRVNTTERIAALRAAMNDQDLVGGPRLDAYLVLISDEHGSLGSDWDRRVQYISGFSGSAGYAIITWNQTALWTDGRYFLQADNQMDCNWILMKEDIEGYPSGPVWLASVLSNGARVGAYPDYVSIATWQSYETALAGKATLVGVPADLVDVIWTDPNRPPRPNNPPFVHHIHYAGVEWLDKVAQVREKLVEQPVDALAVTVLEESAWLFNLRGSDQSYSLFFAYSIVLQNEIRLFLNNYQKMITDIEIQNHLDIHSNGTCKNPTSFNCTNVYEYSELMTHVQQLAGNNLSVWLDPTANHASYSAAGARRLVLRSPVALMKSIKNEVERVQFADCIMRDSAALIEFLALLEKEILSGNNWTEISAAAKLEEIRSTYPDFKGISFETISAYGPHASIIHYRPDPSSPDTNSQILRDNVYLLDSGGQYLDGTTDVTRTVHYGTPKQIVIEAYTHVLMGSVDLALTVWPEGLYGSDIDVRARAPLWQKGWDYKHGTGHGIGYFLSVHEGPGRINIGFNDAYTPIYEGMFLSDEPGYYEDNSYGIRLETLVQVTEANVPNHFGNKKFLGFKPVTLVPFEPKLINYSSLSEAQIAFLNSYNQRCLSEVGPYLLNVRRNKEAYDWLAVRVDPIPSNRIKATPQTSSTSGLSSWMALSFFLTAYVAINQQ